MGRTDDYPKVLLVVPNYRWAQKDTRFLWTIVPYNLCMLAATVRDICNVEILDAYLNDMSRHDVAEHIKRIDPDYLGVTALMDQCAEAAHETIAIVKAHNSRTTTILGGVYATVNQDIAFADKNIDYVVCGEGEKVFREIVEGKIPTRDRNTAFERHSIDKLDSLPLPAYDLIDFNRYAHTSIRNSVDSPSRFPYARIITSRGCPQNCCFCQVKSISGRKWRPRSAENVVNELAWLKSTYGIRSFIIDDDNFLTNRRRAVEIFTSIIDRELVMPWKTIATAVFALDEELIALLRRSGCEYICVAIESGNKRILSKVIDKPVDLGYARKMVKCAQQNGIYVAANFVIGFPTETWDEIRESLAFANELNADYTKIFSAIPLKKTRLWSMCEDGSLFKHGFDHKHLNWNVGQIKSDYWSDNDLTILRAYEWDRINFSNKEKRLKTCKIMGITEDELLTVRRKTLEGVIYGIKEQSDI